MTHHQTCLRTLSFVLAKGSDKLRGGGGGGLRSAGGELDGRIRGKFAHCTSLPRSPQQQVTRTSTHASAPIRDCRQLQVPCASGLVVHRLLWAYMVSNAMKFLRVCMRLGTRGVPRNNNKIMLRVRCLESI